MMQYLAAVATVVCWFLMFPFKCQAYQQVVWLGPSLTFLSVFDDWIVGSSPIKIMYCVCVRLLLTSASMSPSNSCTHFETRIIWIRLKQDERGGKQTRELARNRRRRS